MAIRKKNFLNLMHNHKEIRFTFENFFPWGYAQDFFSIFFSSIHTTFIFLCTMVKKKLHRELFSFGCSGKSSCPSIPTNTIISPPCRPLNAHEKKNWKIFYPFRLGWGNEVSEGWALFYVFHAHTTFDFSVPSIESLVFV